MGNGHAFITGGSSGIGAACVAALQLAGWQVIAPTIEECDVRSTADLDRSMGKGILNAVIACAGLRNAPDGDVIGVNLGGVLNTVNVAAHHLAPDGRIVLIASVSAITPAPGRSAYAASKAGVRAIGASVRKEHRHFHVTTMILGATDTPIWGEADTYPREKMLRPSDVADAIVWVLDRPACVSVDEMTLVPQAQEVRPPGW